VSRVDLRLCDLDLAHLIIASEARIDHLHQLSLLKECEESVREDLGLREGDLHKSALIGKEEVITHVLEFKVVGDTRADEFVHTDGFGVEDFWLEVYVEVA
jgi:hypothetical protein